MTITKDGSPVAVILAVADHQSLVKTLEIPSDPMAVAEVRDPRARMDHGETFGEDDIRARDEEHAVTAMRQYLDRQRECFSSDQAPADARVSHPEVLRVIEPIVW